MPASPRATPGRSSISPRRDAASGGESHPREEKRTRSVGHAVEEQRPARADRHDEHNPDECADGKHGVPGDRHVAVRLLEQPVRGHRLGNETGQRGRVERDRGSRRAPAARSASRPWRGRSRAGSTHREAEHHVRRVRQGSSRAGAAAGRRQRRRRAASRSGRASMRRRPDRRRSQSCQPEDGERDRDRREVRPEERDRPRSEEKPEVALAQRLHAADDAGSTAGGWPCGPRVRPCGTAPPALASRAHARQGNCFSPPSCRVAPPAARRNRRPCRGHLRVAHPRFAA